MNIKKKIKKVIFQKESETPFTWFDIKDIEFQDDDQLQIGYDEGFYSENESWDPHYFVIITRSFEETDNEFAERIKDEEEYSKWLKALRYETYLNLKKEFESV